MAKAATNVRIAVIGGGISGLMATLKICEAGGEVDLFSYCPPKRSHSLCAQGGMNACMDTKGEGDTTYTHFDDTVYGGDFLADQVAVKGMCEAAPGIVEMFDRMGATAAVIALVIIMLLESGHVGEYKNLADMGLTAMIVVLAVSLVGSLFYKTKKK